MRRQDLKELKFRPSTDVHDYQVRLRSAQKFIAKVRALLQHSYQLNLYCGRRCLPQADCGAAVLPSDEVRCLPAQGDKVKLTITFKGREMQFQDIGRDLFKV